MERNLHNEKKGEVTITADSSTVLMSLDSPWTTIKRQIAQIRSNFQVILAPGERQFKDLPKRVRLMVISFVIPVLFGITKLFIIPSSASLILWGGVALLLGALTYGGVYWGLKGQVRKESYFSTLLLPAVLITTNVIFLSTVFVGEINRLYLWGFFAVSTVTFMLMTYLLTLTVNVLNVSLFYTIPLSRLGESIAYISGVIIMFLLTFASFERVLPLLVSQNLPALAAYGSFSAAIIVLLVMSLLNYFVPYSRTFWAFSLSISLLLFATFLVSVLFMPTGWAAAIVQAAVSYVLLGYVIHKEQNTLNKQVIIEFCTVTVGIFLLVSLV